MSKNKLFTKLTLGLLGTAVAATTVGVVAANTANTIVTQNSSEQLSSRIALAQDAKWDWDVTLTSEMTENNIWNATSISPQFANQQLIYLFSIDKNDGQGFVFENSSEDGTFMLIPSDYEDAKTGDAWKLRVEIYIKARGLKLAAHFSNITFKK